MPQPLAAAAPFPRAVVLKVARGLARLSGLTLSLADAVGRDWAARRLLRQMRDWPDERLRDIGIARADLAAAVLGTKCPFRWVPETDAMPPHPLRFGH